MELFFIKNLNKNLAIDEEIHNINEETIQNSLIGVEELLSAILKKEKK